MIHLYNTPPEKYYEACITYHLIHYFKERYHKTLYPFSISQVREKQLGFDFGYELSKDYVFFVQYKRPLILKYESYAWRIDRNQLNILLKNPLRTLYALPAFSDTTHWYEGLDKTHFLPAHRLQAWMQYQSAQQSALLHETEHLVTSAHKRPYDPFGKELNSALCVEPQLAEDGLSKFLENLPSSAAEGLCGYRIGG